MEPVRLSQAEREDLERAFRDFRDSRLFPSVPHPSTRDVTEEERDELNWLHADLVLYSSDVFGTISNTIRNGVLRIQLRQDNELNQRMERVIQQGSPAAVAEAKRYAAYLDALHELVQKAMAYGKGS